MKEGYRRTVYWDRVALLIVILIIFGFAAWWLESRFGSNWAAAALGALAGVLIFVWGGTFAWTIMRSTLQRAAQFNADLAAVEEKRQAVHREHVRLETLRWRSELEYERDVRRMAEQRAKFLIEQQAPPQAQPQQIAGEWQEYD
jgi:hypothetical protein